MSSHYNDAFENPDYYSSETLQMDKLPSRRNSTFDHTPYDSFPYAQFDAFNKSEGHTPNPPVLIPMTSMQRPYDVRYDLRDLGSALLGSNSQRNGNVNFSFEYKPEFAETLSTTSHVFKDHDAHRPSDASGRVNAVQRLKRRNRDGAFALLHLDSGYSEAKKKEEEKLIHDLSSMSTHERLKAIQKIPRSMKEKREIRNRVLADQMKQCHRQDSHLNCCTQCFYTTALSFRQFKNDFMGCLELLQFWQKTLKDIGSQFGSSIRSYFVFLSWLLMFNVFSFVVNFSFLAVPQLLAAQPKNHSFTGLEFFTGAGYFTNTVLYNGFYTNATIAKIEIASPYYMQLAYIFTLGVYFIICFLTLLYSMAKSVCNNFIHPQTYTGNAAKLLCIWDFSIVSEKGVKMNQKNISTQIKETLAELRSDSLKLSLTQKVARLSVHLAVWSFSLGTSVASCAGIYFFSLINLELFLNGDHTELENEGATLFLPIVVSLLNHTMPFLFSLSALVEKFSCPRDQVYTAILRNIILKISIIGILCYYWLNIVAVSSVDCWETLVGQDIYRLIIADFVCCLLGSFFGEFLRRLVGTKCYKKLGVPEFDIARNVLDLIYAQTLTWIGIFFSPLLPAVQMIAFFIIFCVKKVSLLANCQPPRKAWRGSRMNTIFIFLLFFPSFIGVLSVIAVTVWRRKPSEACGPFRGLETAFQAISGWVSILASYPSSIWVVWIYHNLFESVHFFFILSAFVLIITYRYWQIIDGQKTMVKLLRQQIVNAGKDKMFLLMKLRALQASKLPSAQKEPERCSSLHQLPEEQMQVCLPNCTEHSPWTDKMAPSTEDARISAMTSFSHETGQRARNAGVSEALSLALRARQEAEWESDDEDSA